MTRIELLMELTNCRMALARATSAGSHGGFDVVAATLDDLVLQLAKTEPPSGSSDAPYGGGYGGSGGRGSGGGGGWNPKPPPPDPRPEPTSPFSRVTAMAFTGVVVGLLIRLAAIFSSRLSFIPHDWLQIAATAALIGVLPGTLLAVRRGAGAAFAGALLSAIVFALLALAIGWFAALLPLNTWLGFPLCGAVVMAALGLLGLLLRRR